MTEITIDGIKTVGINKLCEFVMIELTDYRGTTTRICIEGCIAEDLKQQLIDWLK
jgi:hypothetical protein